MKFAINLVALLLVVGCGSSSDSDETIGKEIAEDYNRALDDAAAVEEQLQQQQRQIEEAIEDPE